MAVSRLVTTAWKRSMEGFHELNDAAPQRKTRKRACAPIAEQQVLPSPRRFVSLRACSSVADGDADSTPAEDHGGSSLAPTVRRALPPPIAAAASSAPSARGERSDTPVDRDEPTLDERGRPSAGCRCPPGDRAVRSSPRASLRRHAKRSQGAAAAGRCQELSASSRERTEEHEILSSSQRSSSASGRSASVSAVSSQPLPLGSCSSGDCISNSYEVAGRGGVWRTFVMQQHKGRCRVLARKVRLVRHATYKSARAVTVEMEREAMPARHDRPSDGLRQPQRPGEARDSRQQLGACEEAADDHSLIRNQQQLPQAEQDANEDEQRTSTLEEETDDDTLVEPQQGRRQHVKLVDATWVHQSPMANESFGSCVSLGNGADGASPTTGGFPEAVPPTFPATSRSQAGVAPSLTIDTASSEHAAVQYVSGRDGNHEQTASASAAASPDHRPPSASAGAQAYADESIVMTQWSLPASIASGTIDCATPVTAADLPENGGGAACHVSSPAQSAISESLVISELPTQNDSSCAVTLCHPGVLCNCADRHRRDVQPPTSGLPVDALPCNCSSVDLAISLPLVLGEPCEGAGLCYSGTWCSTDSIVLPKRPQRHGQIAPAARRPRTVRGGLAQRLLKVISRDASARAVRSHDLRSGEAESGDREYSSSGLLLEVLRGSVDADGVPVATCLVVGGNSTSVGIGATVVVVLHDFVAIAKQGCGLPVGTIVELCSPWTVIQSSGDAPLLVSSSFYHICDGSSTLNREWPIVNIEPVRLGTRSVPTTLLEIVQCTCIDMAAPARTVLPCDANVLYTGMFSCL